MTRKVWIATGLVLLAVAAAPSVTTTASSPSSSSASSPSSGLELTWITCATCPEVPEVTIVGNTVTMGQLGDPESGLQNTSVHGAGAILPPASSYRVTINFDLHTWDSYNAVGTPNPPYNGGTGYWDSFSVSISQQPYWDLPLSDPIGDDDPLAVGFLWGGISYGDGFLESNTGAVTVEIPASNTSANYLNVVLDTKTFPNANHLFPSWGTITVEVTPLCGVPPRDEIAESIYISETCFIVFSDRLLYSREDDVSNQIQLFCANRSPFIGLDEFALMYTPVVGPSRQVGRCPWVGGRNEGQIAHVGDRDGDGTVDCFLKTFWRSVEPGRDQGDPDGQDWKTFHFDVQTGRLVLRHFTSADGPGGPEPDILINIAVNVDPRDFNPDPPPSDESDEPMIMVFFEPCDNDRDGDCDADDYELVTNAIGESEDGDNYNEPADADHDGLVTATDQQQLFPVIPIHLDIKLGSDPNSINPSSKGTIPVAILSTTAFDSPSEVDQTSLTFGRTGDEESLHRRGRGEPNCAAEDVDNDGLLDLVCHFETQKTGFQEGDTEGILKGQTVDGVPLEGRDSVRIVN